MNKNADDLQDQMVMENFLRDKWETIYKDSFENITETLSLKPSPWKEYRGKDNRYELVTTIDSENKYADSECSAAAAGEGDRKCRKVTLEITDTKTGKKQALELTKIEPEGGAAGGKGGGLVDFSKAATKSSINNRSSHATAGHDYKMEEDGYCYLLNTSYPQDDYTFYFRHTINGTPVPTTGYVWLTKGDIISGEWNCYYYETGYSGWSTLGAYSLRNKHIPRYIREFDVSCYKPR